MKRIDHSADYMHDHEERVLIDELERDVSRKGGLFALLACLAIAAGLAMSAVITMAALPT